MENNTMGSYETIKYLQNVFLNICLLFTILLGYPPRILV